LLAVLKGTDNLAKVRLLLGNLCRQQLKCKNIK